MARKAPTTWSAATRTTLLHQESVNADIGNGGRAEGAQHLLAHAAPREFQSLVSPTLRQDYMEHSQGGVGSAGEGKQQPAVPSAPSLPFKVGQVQFAPMAPHRTPLFSPAVLISKGQPEGQTESSFALVR
mmetsp:Transcript_62062/g.115156  ORF Transcript_62062/g.115156 Transcript_62062/m.115156 type:complete len:130 (-) Transcript_62062:48-437(-)